MSETTATTGVGRGGLAVPALFCILLLAAAPIAADARSYESDQAAADLHHPAIQTASVEDQQIVHYVEETGNQDNGEGVRQIRASLLRYLADLEVRGYDVADLRSALESGDEERIKYALASLPDNLTAT